MASRWRSLDRRERDVFFYAARQACTAKEISAELGISLRTVRVYLSRIYKVMRVPNQLRLIAGYYRERLARCRRLRRT